MKNDKIIRFAFRFVSPLILFSLLQMAVISVIYSRVTLGLIDVNLLFIPYKFV